MFSRALLSTILFRKAECPKKSLYGVESPEKVLVKIKKKFARNLTEVNFYVLNMHTPLRNASAK